MEKCERCGMMFDKENAFDVFEEEFGSSLYLSYDQLRPCLCENCAI